MKSWILAARPKTLPAAAVPVWIGSLPALGGDADDTAWMLFACTLAACLCIQIATNFFNDAIDHIKGADTPARLGPVRVTASGLLSRRAVMAAAVGFCAAAVVASVPLVLARGWPILLIGAASLFFAYGYTGGPFPLAYRGMGELFVIFFFGFVAVSGSYFVQTGQWGGVPLLVLGLQCGLYSSALLAINNLRDHDEDRSTGKRTLAVRFGKQFARWEIVGFCLLPLALWSLLPADLQGFAALLPALAGVPVVVGIFLVSSGPIDNTFLALAALQLVLFAVAVTWQFWAQ